MLWKINFVARQIKLVRSVTKSILPANYLSLQQMKQYRAMKLIRLTAVACTFCLALPSHAGTACVAKSGPATAALVELYTSEGCSSCPPADLELHQLRQKLDANAAVVPLALHVSYWDQIGWKDVFAQKIFDARQVQLVANRQGRAVYTPQFFVNGTELRAWRDDLPSAIRQINARPAPLTITLKSMPGATDTVALEAMVTARDPQTSGALYLAISESALVSRVLRGENSGATLRHDDIVRMWIGPISLLQGSARMRQEIKLPAAWSRQHLRAVAFVQDQRDSRVLQAVSTAQCDQMGGL
jgi:hypothetical protein